MKAVFRVLALCGVVALAGCDSNPSGPSVGSGENKSGESNIKEEGTKAPASATGNRKGSQAQAPPLNKPD